MWSARQSRKMGRRVAGLLGGLLVGLLLVAAPPAAAFVDPINVSNSNPVPSRSPAIAVNKAGRAGRVFVVWQEGSAIFFTRSQASCGGLKFEEAPLWPRMLSVETGTASRPAVAVDNNRGVFVAWQASSGVLFRRSTDDGETFSLPVNLGPNGSANNGPSVAADAMGGVFVAWSNGGEILFARSLNSGAGFDQAVNLSRTMGLHSGAPSVAAGEGNVFLAWEDGNFPFLSILYKKFGRSDNLTAVAGSPSMNLSSGLGLAFSPSLAFGDAANLGNLSVVFGTLNGPSFYHRWSSGGAAFNAPANVSGAMEALSPNSGPRAARGNNSAMAAWAEPLAGNTDIRYWLGTMTEPDMVRATPGASVSPAAAIDSTGRLLVAWQQSVNGNDEIYLSYQGGTDGGTQVNMLVEMTPQTLNAKTMYQGEGVVTLRIQVPNPADVVLTSLKINNQRVLPVHSSIVGNGELMLKIHRRDLQSVFDGDDLTAAQRNGEYTVTGNTTSGCFSGTGAVRINR